MFKNFTALYVEDEEKIKGIVCTVFGGMFKKFHTSSNGQEGLELFLEHKDEIDVIITDINMPLMNGLEMCYKIREVDIKIPIIITTAHNDKDFLHKAIEIGVSSFVIKPMDIEKLVQAVKKSVEPLILQNKLDSEIKERLEERIVNAKFKAIGQLSAGITHEINTPLTYIKASFEMLSLLMDTAPETDDKELMKQNIERISDGLIRIENIINSMKEMFNQSKIQKENANVFSTVVTSTVLAFNKAKHITKIFINNEEFGLDFDKEKENYTAFIDKQRVEQVWVIIINNAIDELMKLERFCERRLDINISENEQYVIVTFSDNAGGINEDVMEDLFEPFKGTKESSGMGVGLSIAKNIIDQQKGKIEAYNNSEGAVFKVMLDKSVDSK